MLLLVNLWLTCINTLWRVNATVQLHIHAQYVWVHWPWRWQRMYNFSLFGASAADHLCSTVTVLSCWMFRLSWEGSTHDRHRGLSSWLFCVVSHTHTHTHTATWHATPLTHREMYMYIGRGLAWGSVTVPRRGCWVWFYCLYWSWLGLSRGINT